MTAALTGKQIDAMRGLGSYVGKTVEVLTSQYCATVPKAYRDRCVGTFNASTLRGLEAKGYIKFESSYWKGATITVVRGLQ